MENTHTTAPAPQVPQDLKEFSLPQEILAVLDEIQDLSDEVAATASLAESLEIRGTFEPDKPDSMTGACESRRLNEMVPELWRGKAPFLPAVLIPGELYSFTDVNGYEFRLLIHEENVILLLNTSEIDDPEPDADLDDEPDPWNAVARTNFTALEVNYPQLSTPLARAIGWAHEKLGNPIQK